MSRTSNIHCTQCQIGLWIGQSDYVYTGEPRMMLALDVFLQVHRGHPMVFDYDDAPWVPASMRQMHEKDILDPDTHVTEHADRPGETFTPEEVARYKLSRGGRAARGGRT